MELGFGIPIISAGIPDSLSCILDSKVQDSGPQAKIPPTPESRVPYMERRRGYSSSSLELSWSQGVLSSGLVESEILGFGSWNSAQRIRNPTNDWNLESKFTDKDSLPNPVPQVPNPQREIENPRLSYITFHGAKDIVADTLSNQSKNAKTEGFLYFPGNDVNLYEADIDLSPDDVVDLSDAGDVDGQQLIGRKKRNAARNRKKVWVTRVIPYEYDSSLPGRTCYTPTPGGSNQQSLIRGGTDPRSNPLPFYIPVLTLKVPLSYAFYF